LLPGSLPAQAIPPVNDAFERRIQLPREDVVFESGTNTEATREVACEPNYPGASGKTLWWTWSPPEPGFAVIHTTNSFADTILGVYFGKDPCALNLVGSNDDAGAGIPTSWVGFDAVPDLDYVIHLDSKGAASGDFELYIRLYTRPEILGQPTDVAVPEQGEATFRVGALGARPLAFQWEFRRTNAPTFVDIPGATTEVLVRRTVSLTADSGDYRCRVTNQHGTAVSEAATLTVLQPPVVVEQPKGGTPSSCQDWTFSTRILGGQPMTYQWFWRPSAQTEWQELTEESATTTQLKLLNLSVGQSGQYQLRVSNAAGQTRSDIVELNVRPVAPAFVVHPKDAIGIVGESVSFNTDASGCRIASYQWYFRPTTAAPGSARPIEDATNRDLTLDPVTEANAGYYSLLVTDEEGPKTFSREALLKVEIRPPNDPFEKAYPIIPTQPATTKSWVYTTNAFNTHGTTQPPDEPRHQLAPAIYSVWWRFQTNAAGVAHVTLSDIRFPSRMVVYRGDQLDDLTEIKAHATQASFAVEADVPYHIVVDSANATGHGTFQFRFEFATQGPCPEWIEHPISFSEIGDYRASGASCRDRVLSCEASSITAIRYQWLFNGQPIPGATSRTLDLRKVSVEDSGDYVVVARNDCPEAITSRVARVQVTPLPKILREPVWLGTGSQPFSLCTTARVDVLAESCTALTYQWRHRGLPIPGETAPQLRPLILTSEMAGEYDVVIANKNGAVTSVVATLQIDTSPAIRISPEKASYELCDRAVLIYDPKGCADATFQWRKDGLPIPGATSPNLELGPLFPNDDGVYDLEVTANGTPIVTKSVRLAINSTPVLSSQPASRTVLECRDTEFCVGTAASPCAPLTFQWFRKLGTQTTFFPLLNATNSCLALTNLSITDSGSFQVVVGNGLQSVTSTVATLTIDARPVAEAQPIDRRVRFGSSFTNEFGATSCRPITFHWFHEGKPVVLGPRHRILPGGSLAVDAATAADGGAYYGIASNAVAGTQSRTANIRVVTPPPNDHFANRIVLEGTNVTANTYATGGRYHNELASREAGEPDHHAIRANRSVWWTWTAPTPGRVTIDLAGSQRVDGTSGTPVGALDSLLAIYRGDAVGNLTVVTSALSRVSFLAAKGRTFHIAVDGRGDVEGLIQLRLSEQEIIAPPRLLNQPISLAATNGETATFSIDADGSPDLLFQWTKNGNPIPGATNAALILRNVQPSDEANYRVTVSNDYQPATNSYIARLTFGAIIRGQVTDATNDKPIPGAKVYVPGLDPAFTDENGNYELVGVEPNELRADFWAHKTILGLDEPVQFEDRSRANSVVLRCEKRPEYIDFEDSQFQPTRGQSVTNKISMSPILTGMRFVLNWGREPADLDATLLVCPLEGGCNEVNYIWERNGRGKTNEVPYTTFDKDVQNSFGPETITVHRVVPGAYRLYVKKFAENARGTLAASQAAVRVYQRDATLNDNRHLGTVTVPPEGTGRYWHVCDVDGFTGNVVWVNRLVELPPTLSNPFLEPPSQSGAPPVVLPPINTRPNPSAPDLVYAWNLGAGIQSTNRNPTNLFSVPGCYDIGLAVSFSRIGKLLTDSLERPCFITVTNGPPRLSIAFPTSGRIQRAGDPILFQTLAWDTDRLASARRIAKVEMFQVTGSATNLAVTLTIPAGETFAPATTNRYTGTFNTTRPPGVYTFVARATDNHGAVTWSAPVRVDVRDLDGEILIIRNRDHPEITCLTNLLTEPDMTIPFPARGDAPGERRTPIVRVLDQEGLHFDLVRDFRLIIWNDTGDDTAGITTNDVAVLQQARTFGIPLYFIGENLVSDGLRLDDQTARKTWFDLIQVTPAEGRVPSGRIELAQNLQNELFSSSYYGIVEPFSYPESIENAHAAADSAEARATLGAADVLIRFPPVDVVDLFEPRRLSQRFLVCAGEDQHSLDQRRVLARNAVLWLLRNDCDNFGATIQCNTPSIEVDAGQEVTLKAHVSFSGVCATTGTIITNVLPAGFEVVDASISFDPENIGFGEVRIEPGRVRFGVSKVGSGSTAFLEIKAKPRYGGTYSNHFECVVNYRPLDRCPSEIHVRGPLPSMPPLRIRGSNGELNIGFDEPPPCDVQLEVSENLLQWRPLGELYILRTGSLRFPPIPIASLPRGAWFRARCIE